jgi:hypothetical protein
LNPWNVSPPESSIVSEWDVPFKEGRKHPRVRRPRDMADPFGSFAKGHDMAAERQKLTSNPLLFPVHSAGL